MPVLHAGQMPRVYRGKRGVSYVKTAGGNTVGVKMDAEGRLYMFDRAGNLYYDTGDPRLGFCIVRTILSCQSLVNDFLPFLMASSLLGAGDL